MINNPFQYEMMLTSFMKKNKDKKEIDFIREEKKKWSEYLMDLKKTTDQDIRNSVKSRFDAKIKESEEYKNGIVNLIKYEIEKHQNKIKNAENQLIGLKIKEERLMSPSIESDEDIDLSNSSAGIKIIRLKETGIIDLLRKAPCFNNSTNNLAKFLSSVTEEKVTTLQSILNPMINQNGTAQKNNPYTSNKNVNKVRTELSLLGFNPIKS